MAERVVPRRAGPGGAAGLYAAPGCPGLALRAYAGRAARGGRVAGPATGAQFGGFGNTSAGSVVEWNVPEAKVFFNDLPTDKPLPKNLITGASVAGTT